MPVKIANEGERITVALIGDIDHHSAQSIRSEIDAMLEQTEPRLLILDFSGVSFMDSSGIGLVLGRMKLMDSFGGHILIKNPSPYVKKVMLLAGLNRLMALE